MRLGLLRHRVAIENPVESVDAFGQRVRQWDTVHRAVFASIKPASGREIEIASAQQGEVTHRVVMRYVPDVTVGSRVVFDRRIFDVRSVVDEGENQRWLTLRCVEGLNDG